MDKCNAEMLFCILDGRYIEAFDHYFPSVGMGKPVPEQFSIQVGYKLNNEVQTLFL